MTVPTRTFILRVCGPTVLLATLGVVLLVSAGLAFVPALLSDDHESAREPLANVVPPTLNGWVVRTLPIAESAEARSAVESILRYDDVIYRSYRKGSVEVQVYAAYWRPGSVPYGQAGVHTPDTCWVNAGWTMNELVHGSSVLCGNARLKPAEWRRFTAEGRSLHVLFWHLVGGRVHTYEQYGWRNGLAGYWERLPLLFQDVRRYGFNLAQDQLFLRISSDTPFAQLLSDAEFQTLLRALAPLGVFAPTTLARHERYVDALGGRLRAL